MISWIAFSFSVAGIFLNARKNIWCWPVWLASNVFWIIHTTAIKDNAVLMTWVIFAAFNVYGWYSWYIDRKGKKNGTESNTTERTTASH